MTLLPSDESADVRQVLEALGSLRAGQALPQGISDFAIQVMHRLATTERLAGIGEVAAGVAHEINNPVACVLAANSALKAELKELEALAGESPELKSHLREMREILEDAEEGAARIRDIARDLRGLARADDGDVAVAEVGQVVASSIRVAGAQLKRSARVTSAVEAGLFVQGAPGKLCQVLVNLLVNAAQALASRSGTGRSEIAVGARREGDKVIVEVSDTGPGIRPEHLAHLFEPFFTTKPAATGTGLGLSISRELVRRFGGELRVSSVFGEGATFTLELLAARDDG